MSNPFFERPILNSPYEYPARHWELDDQGQPTQQIIDSRRRAEFITPIPKPKKRKKAAQQDEMVFDEGKGLSTKEQQYDPTSIINEVRQYVAIWRALSSSQWQVSPETARLLQHWRHHKFGGVRPFFCQVEAVETAIWLTGAGWASSDTLLVEAPWATQVSEAQQADYLVAAFAQVATQPYVDLLIVDNFNLAVTPGSALANGARSLIRDDWSARPAFIALAKLQQHTRLATALTNATSQTTHTLTN